MKDIEKISREDKLQTMEAIWADLSANVRILGSDRAKVLSDMELGSKTVPYIA
jgi:hypothetical protein